MNHTELGFFLGKLTDGDNYLVLMTVGYQSAGVLFKEQKNSVT